MSFIMNNMNMIPASGNTTYSNMMNDFTAAVTDATKNITVTGLSFSLAAVNVVAGSIKKIAADGTVTELSLTNVTVASGSIITLGSITNFASTDNVAVTVIGPDKAQDKTLDVLKTIEQSPDWAHYSQDSIEDSTNVATGTAYTLSMDGYKNLSLTGSLVDGAGETTSFIVEGTNDEDLVNGSFISLYGYDSKNNQVVNTVTVTNATLTYAWDFDNLNYSTIRITVTTSASTNTVIIKARRSF